MHPNGCIIQNICYDTQGEVYAESLHHYTNLHKIIT